MSTASESNVSSPVSRGPSPDHGFVLVDDAHDHGQETGALNKSLDIPGTSEPGAGESNLSSRAPSPGPAGSLPAWLLRGAEGLHTAQSNASGDLGAQNATPGNAARLSQENQQLRGQLLELAQQQEWALGSVVASKDREIAQLSSRLRRISNSFDRQSLDLAAFHRDLQNSQEDIHPQIVPVPFNRLSGMLSSKTAAAGMSPSTKVALDAEGLPKYISLDWDTPQGEAAPQECEEEVQAEPAAAAAAAFSSGEVATPFAAQAEAGTSRQGRGRARQNLAVAGQNLGQAGHKAGLKVLQAGQAVGRLPGRALASPPSLFARRIVCQASGEVKKAVVHANRVVARAAHAPATVVGRCFCTAQAAARHLAHALSRPAAKDGLEMALGLCLMALVTQKALRFARSTGSHRHAKRIKQRAPAAAPEPSAPLEDSSEASEVAALQTALQELLDGMDAWKADVLDAPAEDASGDAEADTPLRSQAGDGQADTSKHAAGESQRRAEQGSPSLVTSIFPLELKWPDAPSLDMPTMEVLQGSKGADDIRVLHVDGHSMRLPSCMRF